MTFKLGRVVRTNDVEPEEGFKVSDKTLKILTETFDKQVGRRQTPA